MSLLLSDTAASLREKIKQLELDIATFGICGDDLYRLKIYQDQLRELDDED